jgi:hypothetical protein
MSKVIEANGCMVISDDDVEVVLIKKTDCSMRDAIFKAIDLLSGES